MFAKRWHQTMDQDTETTRKPLGTSKENTRGSLKDIFETCSLNVIIKKMADNNVVNRKRRNIVLTYLSF